VSILTGTALLSLTDADDYDGRAALCVTLGMLVGLVTLALGLFRLGFVECVLSRATNRGFILGVAAVIAIEQLCKLLGIPSDQVYEHGDPPLAKFIRICGNLSLATWEAALVGLGGLAFLLVVGALKKRWASVVWLRLFPSVMVLVVASILLAWGLQLDVARLPILGDVDGGLIKPRAPEARPNHARTHTRTLH
jgi:MFS superfamily sulfate permease-like transporter